LKGEDIKPFSQYKDIHDFYKKTGMTREEAAEYLFDELKRGGSSWQKKH